ncbi:alpha-amylase family glycosyl hydrolase [Acidicapsa dinghuensis]|uniref:Alpha-amylase family glycosyl hydrolase n=1 Tax=Acidicapsa dinghuensis TaxID=2218256 RepID=A0ABW1ENU7_9BACT|nr:alpha-amylase family glycosyl hydrolase [Acidicapsa dinghuensis]
MEFHISRAIRSQLDFDGLLFSYTGNVVFANVAAARKLAAQFNALHLPGNAPEKIINGGALFAMGLIDELNHALVARYREEVDPAVLSEALRWFADKVGPENVDHLLLSFVEHFPTVDVYQGHLSASQWLAGNTENRSNREVALEELMLLWLTNINPAFSNFRELFDDSALKASTPYPGVTSGLPAYLGTRPPLAPEAGSLFEALSAPMRSAPDSLTGQLDFIRENWSRYLGEDLRRVLLAIDVVREEDLAIWMRFNPPQPDWHRHAAPGFGGEGFIGDEYVGFDQEFGGEYIIDADGVRRRRYDHDYQAPLTEYEAFSADQSWMPNVVLMAKSTYVWLEQLSQKYGRHIHHLDHIPDEELHLLAERGITGLWLIGLWERSIASRTIKRLRGHSDAVASAYSLKEYNIAEDLGGTTAYSHLRDRAAAFGIRLASDMVPNHMGIDSPWVIDHPEWFISRPDSPYPAYSFNGPDISPDPRAEIKIEDHYYDQSDAAVVFRLRHHHDGSTRFVYHGNDGTSFAWNDTAQLDYSKARIREHVIQTILHVARQFPIIRFDAAMVLAKRHVQRLWFPLPGVGGSIPSRAEYAMPQEAFDALMPHEFWREVVDRVAAEVPGTLLLAEAFWLLEGYFVRTLGMHRVYNSAFMVMLRDEENAKFRSYLKKTIEFDPDIMKRYVNFMSNPDEKTAIDQFGWGDKYFGVCTMLVTLPGLPMFAHGQIEGYTERYGMEFKQARMKEQINEGLVGGHMHFIAPLLRNRALFAESHNFVLYDFWTDHGTVDENVFVYSNRLNDQRSLVIYNNRYGGTRGTIHTSAASMDKSSGNLRQTSLATGLALTDNGSAIFAYRDTHGDLEYLRRASDFYHHGLTLDLRNYQTVVLLNWRELYSTAEQPWDALCDALAGRGVPSVNEALLELRFRPVRQALREAISLTNIHRFAEVAADPHRRFAAQIGKQQLDSAAKPATETPLTAAEKTAPLSEAISETEPIIETPSQPTESDATAIRVGFDIRLAAFLEQSSQVFERIAEHLPEELHEAVVQSSLTHNEETNSSSAAATAPTKSLAQIYAAASTTLADSAARLPHLERSFSDAWPSAIRLVLPSNAPGISLERTWAPVLAWITLQSVPAKGSHLTIFEQLHLRSALAEVFSAIGLEPARTWHHAAMVYVLQLQSDHPTATFDSEEFWSDPDVRWLVGVNEHEGKLYFNKELFEELLCWIQLPALLAIAEEPTRNLRALALIEAEVASAIRRAHAASFDLRKYLSPNATMEVSRKTTENTSLILEEEIDADETSEQSISS